MNAVEMGATHLASQPRGSDRALRVVHDYDVPNVSEKIVRIILSYTDYVRRVVWREAGLRFFYREKAVRERSFSLD